MFWCWCRWVWSIPGQPLPQNLAIATMEEEKSPFLEEEVGDQGSDTDDEVLYSKHSKSYPKRKRRFFCCLFVGILVLSLVAAFFTGAAVGHYTVPKLALGLFPTPPPTASSQPPSSSANSHSIADDICANPPLLLLSLDALWSEYLKRNFTPLINSLAASGVRAEYMRSEYPTKTFPNHFSIVTGLHPESHGIVSNFFYDVDLQEEFEMPNDTSMTKSQWWLGEPIWVTAVKKGLKTGVCTWPGAEVNFNGILPTIYYPHHHESSFDERMRTVLSWFDLPTSVRPQLMLGYAYPLDSAGHTTGPNSQKLNDTLVYADNLVKIIYDGLKERGIEECVNIIIVSDHGMAPFGTKQFVQLSELLPKELIDYVHIDEGVAGNIYVPAGSNHSQVVKQIYNILVRNGTVAGLPFRAYLKENLPLRLHAGYHHKRRYGDIILISDEGSTTEIKLTNRTRALLGSHGYDNILKDVQASFIAHGPAFRKGYVSEPFANIELYNLMCGLLGIEPLPNNGTTGSLHHLLTPSLLPSFPPPQALPGTPGITGSCPYPLDEDGTYSRRSFCEECVCWRTEECADVSNATIDDSNLRLNLITDEISNSQVLHLPWGVPSGGEGSSSCLLTQQDYVTLYSNALHIPLWTAFKLTKRQAGVDPGLVDSCLRRDPRVPPASSSNCTDYTAGGREGGGEEFVTVRLAAAALSTQSTQTQRLNANLLSSVVPQMKKFNTRVWQPLEKLLRSWAVKFDTVHVILGSVLDTDRDGARDVDGDYIQWVDGAGGVAIPTHFYAVVVRCVNDEGLEPTDCKADQLNALGMLFQHPTEPGDPSPVSKLLRFSLTPVRDIERVTGVDFFPSLSPQQQNTLELRITNQLWTTD